MHWCLHWVTKNLLKNWIFLCGHIQTWHGTAQDLVSNTVNKSGHIHAESLSLTHLLTYTLTHSHTHSWVRRECPTHAGKFTWMCTSTCACTSWTGRMSVQTASHIRSLSCSCFLTQSSVMTWFGHLACSLVPWRGGYDLVRSCDYWGWLISHVTVNLCMALMWLWIS